MALPIRSVPVLEGEVARWFIREAKANEKKQGTMKTRIFTPSFIVITILLFVSCGKKQKSTDITTITANTELRETVTNNEHQDLNNDEGNDQLDSKRKNEATVAKIIELVRNRDKEGLSKMIAYPLERKYPVPPVRNEKEFIERFDEIFDSELIEKMSKANPEECWGHFGCGLFMIEDLGYLQLYLGFYNEIHFIEDSDREKFISNQLIEAERNDLHESLKNFIYPVILMESPTNLIRIDCIKENEDKDNNVYRYASWKNGSSISNKPDLILTNGFGGIGGSQSFGCYKFINGNLGYLCNVGVCTKSQAIEDSYVLENVKVDEYGWMHGDIILEHASKNTKVIYWSEERAFRK